MVSKIVCQHKLEWSYEPDTIVQQVEKFFDDQINLKPENEKEDLKKIKKEKLDIIKEQAEKTMFWGKLTEATYTPEPSERDKEYETKKTEINNKYNAVAIDASANTNEKKQAELDTLDKEYKKGEYAPKERTVPNADNVYCFHPVAFVEQLKLIAGKGNEGKCKCKEYDLIWGNKVSCEFRRKVVEICMYLWGENRMIEMANGLMAVMNIETGGSFKAHQIMGRSLQNVNTIVKDDFFMNNKTSSRAIGLIQFTQAALVQIGEFTNGAGFDKLHEVKLRFAKMGEVSQLEYVKKYFEKSKDKIKTPEDIYLHVFAPTGVGKKEDFVLYSEGTEEYSQNKSVDKENNGDGKIQRSEILGRYNTSRNDGALNKATNYICQANTTTKSEWHDPVDNPARNKYNSYGNIKPLSGAYGNVRNSCTKYHSGIDLFAIPGTKVYSCLKGKIVESSKSPSAGETIRIKIDNVKDLLDQMNKINYTLEFKKGEILGINVKETDDVYLIYMHLSERYFTNKDVGKEIEAGTVIGLSGVSGSVATSIPSPHLHFEIATVLNPYGTGGTKRTNPARFIKLNSYNTVLQDNSVNYKYNEDGTKDKWVAPKEDQTKL